MIDNKYRSFGEVLTDLFGKSIGGINLSNIGECLVGKVGKDIVLKLELYKGIEADKYLGVRVYLIDKNTGDKSCNTYKFNDYFNGGNKSYYIWNYYGELSWYNGNPSTYKVGLFKKEIRKLLP